MLPARPERALRLLKHLHELMRAGRPAALVSASFALLDACVGTPLKPVDQGYGGLVRKAKLLLESELIAGGGVEKLSASLGVERTTLFRAFKAEAGVSPHEYIDKLKLHRAMELLSSTKIPVSSAAAQCGFSDVKYFTSWFKAKVGQPPAAWRARREREKES
jgi:AraC-like DNA-binding protein